jgi:hypothetical protein
VADYAKLAAEAKANRSRAQSQAETLKERETDFESFFQRVRTQVAQELEGANLALKEQGEPELHFVQGWPEGRTIELSDGQARSCKAALDMETSRIEAEVPGEPDARGAVKVHRFGFFLMNGDLGVRAFEEGSIIEPEGGMAPSKVAEAIVAAAIRGRFA